MFERPYLTKINDFIFASVENSWPKFTESVQRFWNGEDDKLELDPDEEKVKEKRPEQEPNSPEKGSPD